MLKKTNGFMANAVCQEPCKIDRAQRVPPQLGQGKPVNWCQRHLGNGRSALNTAQATKIAVTLTASQIFS